MTDYDALARYYDLEHADYQDDLAMYAGFATALEGTRLGALELACGTGRCLLPLAGTGTRITGLDRSPAMLAIAREKVAAAALEPRVRLIEGDMRDFSLGRNFGLVFIALNSLMHLETQGEQRRALACAAQHLAPEGRLIVDLFNPSVALPDEGQEGQLFMHCMKVLPSGAHLLHFQSPRVDRVSQLVTMANYYDEVAPDGQVKRLVAPFSLRYVTPGELELLMPAAGLELEALYGTYDLDPFGGDSPRLIAVAHKA
jgi:SAM-dependent methyltransferase